MNVDTTKAITHVSLCAGYGGIDLGLKRAIPSLRTIAFSEIESFACANLVSKMEAGLLDPAPIWTDLKTFPWAEFHGRVDILSGGYPCQPFSAAGKRLGAEDPRHLWPHISAGIAAMRPSVCFFENVEGHISLGLPDVIEDLAGLGYRTTWGIFSASEVGAPHQRKRVFILALANANEHGIWSRLRWEARQGLGELHSVAAELADSQCAGLEGFRANPGQSTEPQLGNCGGEGCGELANTERASIAGWRVAGDMAQAQGGDEGQGIQRQWMRDTADHCGATPWPSRPGEQQYEWEPPRVVGAVPAKLADFCAGNEQPRHDAAPASGEGAGQRREGADANAHSGSSVCGGDQGDEPTGTLVDAKSQRAGQRSELRNEECGSRGALPWDVEQQRKTQPPLGRDADGLTYRLDDAVLHVSTDNRTDELRLLGNGVVPATAERAFRVLVGELMEAQQ